MKLLTLGNTKIIKGIGRGYLPAILHLAPFTLAGVNVCPMADVFDCWRGCLNTSGHGGIAKGGMVTFASITHRKRTNAVQTARIRRTRQFHADTDTFMSVLADDIRRLQRRAKRLGLVPCVRLNGTSDIRWENIPFGEHPNIFAAFPTLQFYDYTKVANRRSALGIPNYHLTYSYSGVPAAAPFIAKALETYPGINLAVVFDKLPATFMGRDVINGDETDLRFLDKPGQVVGLTAKGNAKKDTSGFVIRSNAS